MTLLQEIETIPQSISPTAGRNTHIDLDKIPSFQLNPSLVTGTLENEKVSFYDMNLNINFAMLKGNIRMHLIIASCPRRSTDPIICFETYLDNFKHS